MARTRRHRRLYGHYRLSRLRDTDLDEEDGNETVIEYSTDSDSDEDEPRETHRTMPRGIRCCRECMHWLSWYSLRDLIIVALILVWLVYNMTDHQKEQIATWQRWWDSTAVPTVRNITTESVASLRRFHNHNTPKTERTGHFYSEIGPGNTSPVV